MEEKIYCNSCKMNVKVRHEGDYHQDPEDPSTVICDDTYYCKICECIIPEENFSYVGSPLEDAISMANCLKTGRNHPNILENVNVKIGDVKTCRECGRITDVINYDSMLLFDGNGGTVCSHCPNDLEKYENTGEDWADDYVESERMYAEIHALAEMIWSMDPPKSDSVFEMERIIYIIGEVVGDKYKEAEYELALKHYFMNKCGELGLLRP